MNRSSASPRQLRSPIKPPLALPAMLLSLLLAGCQLPEDNSGSVKDMLTGVQTYSAVTQDGWTISLRRYEPARIDPSRMPVVLCHGLSYNGLFWDLREDVSLARYLAAQGYDVWVPSLRGSGWSTKPGYSRLRQLFRADIYGSTGGAITSGGKGLLKWNWTVDDHARYDVPAILDAVTRNTGLPHVDWIGHSMGGMIMEAHLSQRPDGADPRVRSFIAVATPVFILQPPSEPLHVLADARVPVELGNAVVSTNLPSLIGIVGGTKVQTPIERLFYNSSNMDDEIVRRLSSMATDDISPGQFAQLLDMVSTGKFRSVDKNVDYAADLRRIRTPALWVAGTVDNLATVGAVQLAFSQYGAAEKQYRLFGRVNGQSVDYGHDDLIVCKTAREEVWPSLTDWLAKQNHPATLPGEELLHSLKR